MDDKFHALYDAYCTTSGVGLLIAAVVVSVAAFYSTWVTRSTGEGLLRHLFGGPSWITGLVGLVAVATVYLSTFVFPMGLGLVLPLICGLLLVCVTTWAGVTAPPVTWEPTSLGSFSRDSVLLHGGLFLVAALGFVTANLNGGMRSDHLDATGTGFMGFCLMGYMGGIGLVYLYTLLLRTVDNFIVKSVVLDGEEEEKWRRPALFAFGVICVVALGLGALQVMSTVYSVISNEVPMSSTPDRMAIKSTVRTRQMVRGALLLLVVIPGVLTLHVMPSRPPFPSKTPEKVWALEREELAEEWQEVGAVVGIGVAVLSVASAVAMKVMVVSPLLYMALSNLMLAAAFFLFAVRFVMWSRETLFLAVGLCMYTWVKFFASSESSSNLDVCLVFGASFVLVKQVSRLLVDSYEANGRVAQPPLPLLTWLGPSLLVAMLWGLRAQRRGRGSGAALVFAASLLLFSVFYLDTATHQSRDPFLRDGDLFANIGLDFVVVTTLAVVVTCTVRFAKGSALKFEKFALGAQAPVTVVFLVAVVYAMAAYFVSVVYATAQKPLSPLNNFIVLQQLYAGRLFQAIKDDWIKE
mmetsp:Transcript_9287/g.16299  ORF Transcript_9287/g.16299 Transcript_9287/m.16299 type:complete len:579 (+) Transcript_9287:143-1879(+)